MTPFDPLVADYATWAAAHFQAEAGVAAVADLLANPDRDGLNNLMEYFYGTDPKVANAVSPQQMGVANGRLTLSFTRNPGASDLTATVRGADGPAGPWTDLAQSVAGGAFVALVSGVTVTESGTASVNVTVSDLYPIGDPVHPARFLCLQVAH